MKYTIILIFILALTSLSLSAQLGCCCEVGVTDNGGTTDPTSCNCTESGTIQVTCDDLDPCTINDLETVTDCDESIVCVPCVGTPIAECTQTTEVACNDGDDCTSNDIQTIDCDGSICVPCGGTAKETWTVNVCFEAKKCDGNNTKLTDATAPQGNWQGSANQSNFTTTQLPNGCFTYESTTNLVVIDPSQFYPNSIADEQLGWYSNDVYTEAPPSNDVIPWLNITGDQCDGAFTINMIWGLEQRCFRGKVAFDLTQDCIFDLNNDGELNGITMELYSSNGILLDQAVTGGISAGAELDNPLHYYEDGTGGSHDGFYRLCLDCIGEVFIANVSCTPLVVSGTTNLDPTCYNQGDEIYDYDNNGDSDNLLPSSCGDLNMTTPLINSSTSLPPITYGNVFGYIKN